MSIGIGIGNPVARRRWISERRCLHALNYCVLLPGPEALQLATDLGWPMHRSWGGIVAGGLFVLPSLFILAGGPLVEATHGRLGFTAPLSAITAAVVGVMSLLAACALLGLVATLAPPMLR